MNEGSACAEKEEEVKITSLLRGYCIEMSHAALHYIAMKIMERNHHLFVLCFCNAVRVYSTNLQ